MIHVIGTLLLCLSASAADGADSFKTSLYLLELKGVVSATCRDECLAIYMETLQLLEDAEPRERQARIDAFEDFAGQTAASAGTLDAIGFRAAAEEFLTQPTYPSSENDELDVQLQNLARQINESVLSWTGNSAFAAAAEQEADNDFEYFSSNALFPGLKRPLDPAEFAQLQHEVEEALQVALASFQPAPPITLGTAKDDNEQLANIRLTMELQLRDTESAVIVSLIRPVVETIVQHFTPQAAEE